MDLREELEKEGNEAKLRECVTNAEIEAAAKKYAFQGFVVCSAKEKKGLNKVFHTAFKVVFQMKNMNSNNVRAGDSAVNTANGGPPNGGAQSSGGCCGNKKKK